MTQEPLDEMGPIDYAVFEWPGRQPQAKPTHRFHIGQTVRMRSRFGISPRAAELFSITGTLPARDNSPQYRIRNDGERHERVVGERERPGP